MALKLKVGKTYISRSGELIEIRSVDDTKNFFKFHSDETDALDGWTKSGRWDVFALCDKDLILEANSLAKIL